MIPETIKIFNNKILDEAVKRFGFEPDETKDLGGFESFVYVCKKNNTEYILKITHTNRRTFDYLMGEIDYVNHLAKHGVNVQEYIKSDNDNYIERISNSKGSFLAYSYKKAHGFIFSGDEYFPQEEYWNDKLFKEWGRSIGKIVSISKKYKISDELYKRRHWFEDDLFAKFENYLPNSQIVIRKKIAKFLKDFKSVSTSENTYGMIHGDIHPWNFCIIKDGEVDNFKIAIFDFDDCEYHWFVNEIAIALFYALWSVKRKEDEVPFTKNYMKHLILGFKEECNISSEELKLIPKLLKLRVILMYLLHYQCLEKEDWDKELKGRVKQWKTIIETDIPLVNIDFSEF